MVWRTKGVVTTDTITPISNTSCCFQGVEPIKYPVFKSCILSPLRISTDPMTEVNIRVIPIIVASIIGLLPSAAKTGEIKETNNIIVVRHKPEAGKEVVPKTPTN